MKDKMLPLGSVIEKNDKQIYTVIGYFPIKQVEGAYYLKQYVCCKYDKGISNNNELYAIDEEEIENIYFLGYKNDILNDYQKVMYTLYQNIKKEGSLRNSIKDVLEKYLEKKPELIKEVLEKTEEELLKGEMKNE